MSAEVLFLDTNVLVYVFDADEPDKQALARQLLSENPEIRLSSQVLSEFYVTVIRKLARPLVPAQALQVVNEWRRFQITAITPQLVTKGISRSIDSRVSFWDGLIVEAAVVSNIISSQTSKIRSPDFPRSFRTAAPGERRRKGPQTTHNGHSVSKPRCPQ